MPVQTKAVLPPAQTQQRNLLSAAEPSRVAPSEPTGVAVEAQQMASSSMVPVPPRQLLPSTSVAQTISAVTATSAGWPPSIPLRPWLRQWLLVPSYVGSGGTAGAIDLELQLWREVASKLHGLNAQLAITTVTASQASTSEAEPSTLAWLQKELAELQLGALDLPWRDVVGEAMMLFGAVNGTARCLMASELGARLLESRALELGGSSAGAEQRQQRRRWQWRLCCALALLLPAYATRLSECQRYNEARGRECGRGSEREIMALREELQHMAGTCRSICEAQQKVQQQKLGKGEGEEHTQELRLQQALLEGSSLIGEHLVGLCDACLATTTGPSITTLHQRK